MGNNTKKSNFGTSSSSSSSSSGIGVGAAKVIAMCLILSVSMQMCCGSAIPIWEFLTRNEKMSYLYSAFGQLVSVHCKATAAATAMPVNQCKRDLLAYGYEKLQTFPDSQLDQLDPYQRGANELIWSSIMREHPSSTLITTRKPLPIPPDSSIIILTHQKTANTAPSSSIGSATVAAAATTSPNIQNPLFDSHVDHKHQFAMDMDIAYGYPGTQIINQKPHAETFLSGPLVFRVRPDGTPVEEDQHRPLPRDEDLETYQLSSAAAGADTSAPTSAPASSGQPKHRKIAMIRDLKQQHFASLALQRDLQPPYQQVPRVRRQQQQQQQSVAIAGRAFPSGSYYYAQGQA